MEEEDDQGCNELRRGFGFRGALQCKHCTTITAKGEDGDSTERRRRTGKSLQVHLFRCAAPRPYGVKLSGGGWMRDWCWEWGLVIGDW